MTFDSLIASFLAMFAAIVFTLPAAEPEPAPKPAPPVAAQEAAPVAEPEPVSEPEPVAEPVEEPEPAPVEPEPVFEPEPEPVQSDDWLADAVAQVDPGGLGVWVFERNGAWGNSDGWTVYLDPNMPRDMAFSVAAHEFGHVMQAQVYGSLTGASVTRAITGGDAVSVLESMADCMALLQGASWVNYGCDDRLMPAAQAILAGSPA